MIHVSHDHHNRAPGLQLLCSVHVIVDDFLFDGDGNLPLHLTAHFRGDKLGGIKVDALIDGGHHAVFQQRLNDFGSRLLHAAGQLSHGDFLGNFDRQRRLFNDLQTQAAHFLLLLGAGLAALEFSALFAVFGLAADLLLSAGDVLDPFGDQGVHPVVKPFGVHLDGGGVHHPALPAPLRLGGLGLGFGSGSRFGRSRRFGSLLHRLGLRLRGGGKDLLQRADLVILCDMIKNDIQLLIGQHLAVALWLIEIFGDDFRHFFRRHAKICGHFPDSIFDKTHDSAPPYDFLPCFLTAAPALGTCVWTAGLACRLAWAPAARPDPDL